MSERSPARTGALLAAVAAPALLVVHTWVFAGTVDLAGLDAWRRLWSDLAVATADWIEAAHGPAPERVVARGEEAELLARDTILRRIEREGRRAGDPLATIADRPFVLDRIAPETKPYDDKGRAVLLGLVFRLRGGIAPFSILWLGCAVAAPLVGWAAYELWRAGCRVAALAFGLLLGGSPYVVETLALSRYPVGFYLAAVLLVVPVTVYAGLRPRPTVRGVAARTAVALAVLTLCVFCRSSAAVLWPGFLAAIALGLHRADVRGRSWWGGVLAAGLLFALPSRLVAGAQQNDVWQPVWEGLGDFDREKGYTWSDAAAEEAARRAGAPGLWTSRSEEVFRAAVLRDVSSDPLWFAGILTRRLASTVSLWKLWPRKATSGTFLRQRTSPNEGVMDKYWTYTTTVDHLGVGSLRVELPVAVLLVPPLLLLGLAAHPRTRAQAGPLAGVACAPALATLVLPVAVTTAGGQEAQAIAVAYLLPAALLAEMGGRASRRRRLA